MGKYINKSIAVAKNEILNHLNVNALGSIYKLVKQKRIDDFFSLVNTAMDRLSIEDLNTLSEYIEKDEGQELLTEYADAITVTPDRRVRMAFALLYCNDPDFHFSKSEKLCIVTAFKNLPTDIINFYLSLKHLTPIDNSKFTYDRYLIGHGRPLEGALANYCYDEITEFINYLKQNRLLLPDPQTSIGWNDSENWHLAWGSNESKDKILSLLVKSNELLSLITTKK